MSQPAKITWRNRIANFCRFTQAAIVAFTVGISLLLILTVAWWLYNADPQRVAWSDYLQWSEWIYLSLLWLSICILTYWTVRIWNEQLPSRDSFLEDAWQAGIGAMVNHGLNFQQTPLFLVLGCSDQQTQRRLLQQSDFKLIMEAIPSEADSPIRWYFTEDRIFLFCHGVGNFGSTQQRLDLHRHREETVETAALVDEAQIREYARTISDEMANDSNSMKANLRTQSNAIVPSKSRENERTFQTIAASKGTADWKPDPRRRRSVQLKEQRSSEQRSSKVATEQTSFERETLDRLDSTEQLLIQAESNSIDDFPTRRRTFFRPTRLLSSSEQVRLETLLEDLCRRLRFARGQVAPINGVLAWVDTDQLVGCRGLSPQSGQALRRDLVQLQVHLGLQATILLLMDRMHTFPGFSELIRRCGQAKVLRESLGERFPLEHTPSIADVVRVCQQSLQTVGGLAYRVSRTPDGGIQPGNHKLFQLVVACRGHIRQALENFLIEAVAIHERADNEPTDPLLFGGLFFAGSGDQATQQGFTRQVFEQLYDQQEMLNWTQRRKQQEEKHRLSIWLLQSICFGLGILLLVLLFWFRFIHA